MEEIVEELFKQLQSSYSERNAVSDDFLMMLNFIFPSTISFALDLLDKKKVTLLTSKSGRSIFQVIGTSGTPYLCLSEGSFCECPAYKYSVLKSGESLMCKHLLAVKLCQAMNCLNHVESSEERMSEMLNSLE